MRQEAAGPQWDYDHICSWRNGVHTASPLRIGGCSAEMITGSAYSLTDAKKANKVLLWRDA